MSALLTLTALHPSGFEVCLQVSSLEVLDATITDLMQRGYTPARSGDAWRRTPAGEPICPKHQVVMRLRSKQQQEWWSHRVIHAQTGEELYCRGYRSQSGPGWEVETTDEAHP
jgi:hypothetical protein